MATNQDNIQINTFTGGMNTDSSVQNIPNDQYIMALNCRFSAITSAQNDFGKLKSIEGVTKYAEFQITSEDDTFEPVIVDSNYIKNIGVVIVRDNITGYKWRVYRFDYNEDSNTFSDFRLVYENDSPQNALNTQHKLSTVLNFEDDDVIKLYIADGNNPLLVINIAQEGVQKEQTSSAKLQQNAVLNVPIFSEVITGNLKYGMVQYAYSLYNKNGNQTTVSSPTKLIPIVSKMQTTRTPTLQNGGESDKSSGVGIRIKINYGELKDQYDKIQIYRITYVENGQTPTIDLIFDNYIKAQTDNTEVFDDVGQSSLGTISLEEYNSISGIHIIPKVIESKYDYLFAANIKDSQNEVDDYTDIFDARSYGQQPDRDYAIVVDGGEKPMNAFYHNDRLQNKSDDDKDLDKFFDSIGKDSDCINPYNDMSLEFRDWYKEKDISRYKYYARYNCRDIEFEDYINDNGDVTKEQLKIVYGGVGKYIDWKFIVTELVEDNNGTNMGKNITEPFENKTIRRPMSTSGFNLYHSKFSDALYKIPYIREAAYIANISKSGILVNRRRLDYSKWIDGKSGYMTYTDPKSSYMFRSLRRDELYRFGIILYNQRGDASSVKWIADIRTPSHQFKGFEPFNVGGSKTTSLNVRPLGIEFIVDIDRFNKDLKQKYADEGKELYDWMQITHYEIVRCNRTDQDVHSISQGVLSRPVKKIINQNISSRYPNYPYTPTGLLTTQNIWQGKEFRAYNLSNTDDSDLKESCNYENHTLYQFVSPEVLYQKDSFLDLAKSTRCKLRPITYVFNQGEYYSPNEFLQGNRSGKILFYDVDGVGGSPAREGWGYKLSRNFVQLAGNNLFFGMPFESKNNDIPVGYKSGDNNMDGIQLLSLFSVRNIIVAEYLSALTPGHHRFTSSNVDGYLYDNDPNYSNNNYKLNCAQYSQILCTEQDDLTSTDTSTIWNTAGCLDQLVTNRLFAYSKLYHQADDLYFRIYDDDPSNENTYNRVVGYKDSYDYSSDILPEWTYNVTDIEIANELSWNELFEDSEDGKNTNFKYSDSVVQCGTDSFCNCVCWGSIDDSDWITEGTWGMLNWKSKLGTGNLCDQMVGPGGRTAVIKISEQDSEGTDNILYRTICCSKAKYWESGMVNGRQYDLADVKQLTAEEDYNTSTHDSFHEYVNSQSKNNKPDYQKYNQIQGGYHSGYIFRNSIGGTYICNLITNNNPYGGNSYSNRLQNTYYSYGDIFEAGESQCCVFDGDTFIYPVEYVSQHQYRHGKFQYPVTTTIVYAVPLESSINVNYDYGYRFSKHLGQYTPLVQIEPSDVNGLLQQTDPLYNYNSVYSCNSYSKYNSPGVQEQSDNLQNTEYRIYYSNPKTTNEQIDSWSVFQPMNYIDVDSRYGQITNMRSFKDQLLFWQEQAVGLLSVNERSQVIDSTQQSIILGTGGVLERYAYFDQTSGMVPEQYCDTQSQSTLYWWDGYNHSLKSYSGEGYTDLGKAHNMKTGLINEGYKYVHGGLFYDNKYDELVADITNQSRSINYDEARNQFTSWYDIDFDTSVKFYNDVYLLKTNNNNLQIFKWNEKQGDRPVDTHGNVIQTCVQYVVNKNPLTTKTFDNQEIVTSELVGYKSFDEDYFNKDHIYTWETDLNYSNTDDLEYTNREGNFRFAIPRALKENGESVEFGNRMRGKYMICTIVDKNNKYDTSISYIMTKFRQSWT